MTGLRTKKRFTRRNWTKDELAVGRAPKGRKLATQAALKQIVTEKLKREVAGDVRA